MQHTKCHLKIGIDEAGRGPWYGPIVAASFAFNPTSLPPLGLKNALTDSKKLSEKKRKNLFQAIIRESEKEVPTLFFGVGVVDNEYIDEYGIKKATQEAMRRSLREIIRKIPYTCEIHSTLIDGNDHFIFPELLKKDALSIIRGDEKVREISGASIIAKVFRDRLMETYSILHPKLRVEKHKGYGTDAHISALNHDSVTSFHRLSFAPVKAVLKQKPQLLLHVCCGPDATVPILDLKEQYEILAFWYDPNIHPRSEYEKRKSAFAHVCEIEGIKWCEGEYDTKRFFVNIKGYEKTPERGEKCTRCYDMRLERSALLAHEKGIPFYTTTLTISPHKDLTKLFELGQKYGKKYGVDFLTIPFRKKNGFDRSVAYTEKHDIYRQSYCGCVYSENFPGKLQEAKKILSSSEYRVTQGRKE